MKLKNNFLLLPAITFFSLFQAQSNGNKAAAEKWIQDNSRQLGILKESTFELQNTRTGSTGETFRFQQELNDVPVYQSQIVIHYNRSNQLTLTDTASLKSIEKIDTNAEITSQQAFDIAFRETVKGEISYQENKLFVYKTEDDQTKLVYRVLIQSSENPGAWETIVDADSGQIISVKDVAHYHKHDGDDDDKKKNKKNKKEQKSQALKVAGTGYVFNPDPLSAAQVAYGGQYVDGNDATNASLDAARTLVNLPEIELLAGVYKLKGTFAEIKDFEAPNKGLFTQSTPNFLFNRNQDGFEAVNVYWHVDQNMRYINNTLGIDCISLYNGGVIWFDPSAVGGSDNSYYTMGVLAFGEGCVDDAEDADVIIHELGHGIHDWITNGNLSSTQGLSEGSGDYWAQSYSRSLNQWPSTNAAYHWMFNWDGHNSCWNGRTTNYAATYPSGLSGTIHTQGQIWSTSLMKIYNIIGKEKTDRAFLEGLALTGSSTDQNQAAIAVRQAALDMVGQFGFTCADVQTITTQFTNTGYTLPAYTCTDLAVSEVDKDNFAIYPNPADDKIFISSKNVSSKSIVEIYSIDGRKVMATYLQREDNSIDVSKLTKGVYILKIDEAEIVHKFIKK